MSVKHTYLIRKMEDLLKSQIHENCKLALPEGLKDLMSDISREVLRAQPQNLYQFIANYLGALLEARETLTIACQVCSDICKCTCDPIKPELYHELRKIGFDEEDVENAIEVIEKHLKEDHKAESVKEQNLLLKLMRKTSINETQLPAVQHTIQKAFKRHSLGQRDRMNFQNESNNKASEAVHHTLQLHKKNKPIKQNETEEMFVAPDYKPCVTTASSTSLAGSYVSLPKFQPYSAHDYKILSEIPEKERLSIYYTENANTTNINPKTIEINNETTVLKMNDEYKAPVFFDDSNEGDIDELVPIETIDDYTEASTSTGLKSNKVKISEEITIEEMEDTNWKSEFFHDNSDDEVQEFIENVESGNESSISSIKELLYQDIDEN